MGIYYNPPPPPSANFSGTPPDRHIPIGNQGARDQPPRRTSALMMVLVLASWPQDLEPRLTRPNEQLQKIAPLTLTYGQQPRPTGGLSTQEYAKLVSLWPADLEPRLTHPNNTLRKVRPETQGQQPRPSGPVSVLEYAQLVVSWPAEVGPQLPWPLSIRDVNAATIPPPPITFVPRGPTGAYPAIWPVYQDPFEFEVIAESLLVPANPDQPPQQRALSPTASAIIQLAWTPDPPLPPTRPPTAAWNVPPLAFVPRQSPPALIWSAWSDPGLAPPRPVTIAPLTLTYGAPPSPTAKLDEQALAQLVGAWTSTWEAQTAPKNAGWNVPPILSAVPYTRPRYDILASTQEPYSVLVVPTFVISPTSSDEPPRQFALSQIHHAIVATWTQTWDVQRAPKSAWQVPPILTVVPYRPLAGQILTAWEPRWIAPPPLVDIAPLTLVYGSQPPPSAPISPSELAALVGLWTQDWAAQTFPDNAAWNAPPSLVLVPRTPLQGQILTAWEPPWIQPPRPISIVTLTLPTGTAPPPTRAALERQVAAVAAWTPDAPAPPPLLRSTVWNVVLAQVPNAKLPALIWRAWEEPFVRPPGRILFAPLTLVYGAPPPPRSPLSVNELTAVVARWVQTWGPQRAPINGQLPAAFVIVATPDYIVVIPADDYVVIIPPDDDSVIVP